MFESPDDELFIAALDRALGPRLAEAVLETVRGRPGSAFVGGWVRDVVLGRPSDDVDVVAPDPDGFAEALGERGIVRKVIVLDDARRTLRLTLGSQRYLDVARLRGELPDDLALRDLRLNAMAWRPGDGLVDPLGGRDDLASGRLRLASPTALVDDPLRALRVWRFALELGGEPTPPLPPGIDLSKVAPERVRVELERILLHPDAPRAVDALLSAGLLPQALPGPLRPGLMRRGLDEGWRATPGVERCLRHAEYTRQGALALRLGWLCGHDDLDDELSARRWPRRTARAAHVTAALVAAPPGEPDAELVRWERWTAWALLGRAVAARDPGAAVAAHLAALDRTSRPLSLDQPVPPLPRPLLPAEEVRAALAVPPGSPLGPHLAALVRAHLRGEVTNRRSARRWLRRYSESVGGSASG